jgi:hypothetical protein
MPIHIDGLSIKGCGYGMVLGKDVDVRAKNVSIEDCGSAIVHGDGAREVNLFKLISENIISNDRDELIQSLAEFMNSKNKTSALPFYERFVALAANHMTLLGPYLPALTKALSNLS